MTDLDELYSRRILELAANISHIGHLPHPQAMASARSKLCGSEISIELALAPDGRVADYAQEVKACLLGQAAASVMAREIVGSSPAELKDLRETMRAMLKAGGPPPSGKWADLAALQGVREYRLRHDAVMIPFDAVAAALDMAAAEARAAS